MRFLGDRRRTAGAVEERDPAGGLGRPRAAVAAAVWAATTAVVLAQLLVRGTVGLADNGDANRLVCRLGLVIGPESSQEGFESDYGPVEPCPDGDGFDYTTSWRPLLRLTYWFSRQVTGEQTFDMTVMAVVGAVLLGAGAAALYLALPGATGRRWPLVALVVVAVSDIGFVTYLNSGYTDQAGFIGLLWVCAGLVGVVVHRTWPWLLVLAAAALFTGTAKSALITVVPAVAIALLLSRRHWNRPTATGRWEVPRLGVVLLVLVAVLGGLTAQVARSQGGLLSNGNQFNLLFYTLLEESDDPQADLRELGLPSELGRFAGMSAWEEDTPWDDPVLIDNAGTIFSWRTYVGFFAAHPGRFLEMVPQSIDSVPDARVDYLANLPGEPGGEAPLAERPSPVFWALGLLPSGWPVPAIAFVWLGAAVLGVRWARSREPFRAARGTLAVFLTAYAVSQSVMALGDGYYELAKHNIHAAFATGLLLAVLLEAGVRTGVAALRRRRAAAQEEPEQQGDGPDAVAALDGGGPR
ncbi:hypothetical protein [Candidatus Blastococcus massiliensis]|uniref:glycan biosynthesis hexose transferase WsfD n=1 Tax=Candidatus Blastococcus massiliensis TaxID=1470358 RepID=UPI0012DE04A3|nr:hypothetical protein [Candidatus Blastococcus massiliensis]